MADTANRPGGPAKFVVHNNQRSNMKTIIRRATIAVISIGIMLGMTGCMSTPESGQIGVVRNGGPFDNHNIRQIVKNGSGNTWVGWFSDTHYYPVDSQQRFFRFATCGKNDDGSAKKCDTADAAGITVQTADGVDVTIEGIFYLNTVFNDSKDGEQALKDFDTQFATRTFNGDHAYDGNGGWSNFLGAIVEPIVINNLRETISGVTCADLVSSCALVQNQTGAATQVDEKAKGGVNKSNISRIQADVEAGLGTDLEATLRNTYFQNIKFSLNRVDLPGTVQDAINTAQASFAQVSQAQAKVKSAKLESQANEERQKGYAKCPTCAQIDATKAIPPGISVWAPGGNYAVTGKGN